MTCLYRIVFCGFLLTMFPMTSSFAAEETKKAEKAEPETACKKRKLTARGRPNRIRVMATMSAIVSWIKRSNKAYGTEYGDWHRALNTKIKCNKVKGSDYHICDVSGKPCIRPKLEEVAGKLSDKKPKK